MWGVGLVLKNGRWSRCVLVETLLGKEEPQAPLDIIEFDSSETHRSTLGSWPSAAECDAYVPHTGALRSQRVLSWASSNSTLVSYLYPQTAPTNVASGWRALLPGCSVELGRCWCFHVSGGSMVKARNPDGAQRCAPKDRVINCTDPAAGPAAKH